MSKRFKKKGKNWSIDVTYDYQLIFILGIIVGLIIGKL